MSSNRNDIFVYKDRLQEIYKDLNKKYSHEFNLSISNGYTVTSRSSKVENIEYHEDMALNVTVYNDFKKEMPQQITYLRKILSKLLKKLKIFLKRHKLMIAKVFLNLILQKKSGITWEYIIQEI